MSLTWPPWFNYWFSFTLAYSRISHEYFSLLAHLELAPGQLMQWPVVRHPPICLLLAFHIFDISSRTVPGRFGPGSFRPGRSGLGGFGQFWGWVVSAFVGGSFRPWVISTLSHFGPISIW